MTYRPCSHSVTDYVLSVRLYSYEPIDQGRLGQQFFKRKLLFRHCSESIKQQRPIPNTPARHGPLLQHAASAVSSLIGSLQFFRGTSRKLNRTCLVITSVFAILHDLVVRPRQLHII